MGGVSLHCSFTFLKETNILHTHRHTHVYLYLCEETSGSTEPALDSLDNVYLNWSLGEPGPDKESPQTEPDSELDLSQCTQLLSITAGDQLVRTRTCLSVDDELSEKTPH